MSQVFMFEEPGKDTLAIARDKVFASLREGSECPCCDQLARMYRRRLNAGMAYALCWLAREQGFMPGAAFIALPERAPRIVMRYGGDFSRLTHWGFIETEASDDTNKRTSGRWRATQAGIDFARGLTHVRSHVLVYNNESHGLVGNHITVLDALGKHFNYAELMAGKP